METAKRDPGRLDEVSVRRTGSRGPGPASPPEAILIAVAMGAERLTVRDVQRQAGVSKSWISQVIAGRRRRGDIWEPVKISDTDLAAVADVLQISPGELEEAGRGLAAEMLARRVAKRSKQKVA